MNNTPEQRPYYDDEISLVDLAATFIRRRRIFYAVFVLVTLAGLAYALLAAEKYQFSTLIQVAEKNPGRYLEAPESTIATLENRWLSEQQTLFRAETDRSLPFDVTFSNPENTGLIRFVSEAAEESESEVEQVHKALIEKIEQRQNALVERERKSIQRRIESVTRSIETLQGGTDTGAAIAEAFERKVELESDLESLKSPEVLVVSRQSADKTGPARTLIVALAIMLGGMAGIFLAFFAQFAASVRSHLADGSTE
ncbi:MAG: Wzz/FepE/Etk N-terminal domain-containing protein [Marinobacter sp.]|uniref:Wzz/FepE/Etk N-terminal domain-containing protein n=1 Tax=Marinobacter sp. TaxID=50741 RepID=UPI0034A0226E